MLRDTKRGQVPLCLLHWTHVTGTVRKLVHMAETDRGMKIAENAEGAMASFNGMSLLVHVHFLAGTVYKSGTHGAILKLGSF